MGLDIKMYNRQFVNKVEQGEPVYNNAADTYGVGIKSLADIEVSEDATHYWRIIGVHHLTGAENIGNHHIYCDVVDEAGKRINGARLVLLQPDANPAFAVIDKPADEPGTNFPLFKSDRANVAVLWPEDQPLPSEQALSLSSAHPDEEAGNTLFHHSFYVVFQRAKIAAHAKVKTEQWGGGAQLSLAETIRLVGQSLIIPPDPDAVFYRFAREKGLGERLTDEYDVEYGGKTYRAQIFEKGIVYAPMGEWHLDFIPREN